MKTKTLVCVYLGASLDVLEVVRLCELLGLLLVHLKIKRKKTEMREKQILVRTARLAVRSILLPTSATQVPSGA